MYEQWKKAVVNLECATDSEHMYDASRRMDELRSKFMKGELSEDEVRRQLSSKTRNDIRTRGTALFISHNDKKYLLTARHVVFDEYSAHKEIEEEKRRIAENPQMNSSITNALAMERALRSIFKTIFRVPSLDEVISRKNGVRRFLRHLSAGASGGAPYTFSPPELDLAIISLNQNETGFANELIELGYKPISTDLFSEGPTSEGAEVFTVGFPGGTSVVEGLTQTGMESEWASHVCSLPVFTWGKVAMSHANLFFYWCDMSIYPGNSGGPVIENGKLVGVVSAQAVIPLDEEYNLRMRIPFGKVIKAKYIKQLIDEQEIKDRHHIL